MVNIQKSFALQEHAKQRIPGLSQLLSKRPDMFSYGVWPGYFKKAKGVYIWDLDGNKYIDMSIGGIGANVLGYADPDVNEAVIDAIQNGCSSSLNSPEEVELADLMCELHPWAEKVRFGRTGGESMAIAVRIARAATGKDKIAFCGYHGWQDWYLAANLGTENALGEHLLPGLSPAGVPKGLADTAFPFRYNNLEELKAIISKHGKGLAAIVMEPIRDAKPTSEFIEGVRHLANESGAILIIDEISAGLRMNTGGSHLLLGIQPDIAVFSKALGNGHPIAAIIGKAEIMETAQKSFISSTYWTERVGFVAALATLRKHKSLNTGDHLMKIGSKIQKGWRECAKKHDLKVQVGGIPPLSHFSFEEESSATIKAFFIQEMLHEGFLASSSFYSMLTHQNTHVDSYLKSCEKIFAKISILKEQGTLSKALLGKPSVSGFKRLT
ncbi:MAG: aminotransferase class III-fold pyridoxal phosphate-dependent enzyme [Deltaproteobacteria bacterium]|nr:aminotransferase class III-fold pyridoxal phosphate-dependent enzyme [Deltaproteobacteria bacterium]